MARYSRQKKEQSSLLNRPAPAKSGARFISSSSLLKLSAATLFSGALISSLLIHLAAGAALLVGIAPHHSPTALSATVYVDLLPVARPRAGDGGRKTDAPLVRVAPPPAAARQAAVKAPAAVVKVKGKGAVEQPVAAVAEDGIDEILAEMRRRRDQKEADAAIADLKRSQEARKKTTPAPVAPGLPGGTGDEVGSGFEEWVRKEFRAGWSAPRTDPTLSVTVDFEYDAQGYLKYYEVQASGDPLYDDSIQRAMERFKRKRLPEPLRKAWKNTLTLQPQQDDRP